MENIRTYFFNTVIYCFKLIEEIGLKMFSGLLDLPRFQSGPAGGIGKT